MNIFHKIALQGLKKSRTKTVVTIIGVILSTTLITGISTFGISLLNYMINGAFSKYGNYHAAFFDVPASFVEERSQDKEVEEVAVVETIGYAMLNNSKTKEKPYLFITGYNEEAFHALPVHLLSGRLPENNTEVVISAKIIIDAGVSYAIGDTISLPVGTRMNGEKILGQTDGYYPEKEKLVLQEGKNYTIVGICQTPSYQEDSFPGYPLITKTDTHDINHNFNLFVKLKNPSHIDSYIHAVKHDYAYTRNNNVLRFLGASNSAGDKIFNTLLYSVAGIVISIVMTCSVFLIRNAFHISLNERMHQFGILLSVGATEKQLRNSVLFEGFCIGMMGIPFGILFGIIGTRMVLFIVAEKFTTNLYDDVNLSLTISIPILLLAAIISLITIFISAYLPAKKAVATPVMECIRQTNEVKVESKAIKTSKLAERIYGLEGMLALKNFKRNKKRYRSIILSLVLSIVLFITVNSFIINLQQASEAAYVYTTYDIAIDTMEMDDSKMLLCYDNLKTTTGIYQSLYQTVAKYSCNVEKESCSKDLLEVLELQGSNDQTVELSVDIQFLDDNAYIEELKLAGLSREEYMGENAKFIAIAKIDEHQNKILEADEFTDMFSNSSINATIIPKTESSSSMENSKEINFTTVNIEWNDIVPNLKTSYETLPYLFTIMIPWSLKDSFQVPKECISSKGLTFRSNNPKESEEEINNTMISLGITDNYLLLNTKKVMQENSNMIFIANVFAYTFIIMISLIAVANIFNTISTNIKLRRRELAMLRSIGISERGFQNMMNFECILYGTRALLFGLPIAILFSFLIYKEMQFGGADNIDFILPWASIFISIFSVFFIIFITMLYSISKIKKENIIDALRDDLT